MGPVAFSKELETGSEVTSRSLDINRILSFVDMINKWGSWRKTKDLVMFEGIETLSEWHHDSINELQCQEMIALRRGSF